MRQSKPLLCLLSLALCFSPALAFATVNEEADTEAFLEVADDAQDLDGASDAVELDIVDEAGEVGQSTIVEEETKTDSPVPSDEESDAAQVDVDEDANGLAEKPTASTEGAIADSAVNDEVQNDALASDNAALADADQSGSSDLPESWKDPNPPEFKGGSINGKVFSVGDKIAIEADIVDADGLAEWGVQPLVIAPGRSYPDYWSASTSVSSDMKPGAYRVVGFEVRDEAGYVTRFYDSSMTAPDWEDFNPVYVDFPDLAFLLGDKDKENFYKPLDGNKQSHKKGSKEPLSVRFDGALEDFVLATVDGRHLPESNYGLKSGSTIITLSSAYLNSLAPGTHQLVAWFNDGGNGIATFTVEGGDKDSVTDIPAGNGNNSVVGSNGDNTPKTNLAQTGDKAKKPALAQTGDKAKKPALAQTGDDADTALPTLFAVASLICFMVARSRIRANSK